MSSTSWTPNRIDTLRKLWAAGISFSEIAAEMGGGITRSAIGGKLYRLGLGGRADRIHAKRTPEELEATKRAKYARRNERRRKVTVMKPAVNLEALRCIKVDPMHKSLIDLDPDGCRYPFGDNPFTFCNRTQLEGHSYCGGHFVLTLKRGQS